MVRLFGLRASHVLTLIQAFWQVSYLAAAPVWPAEANLPTDASSPAERRGELDTASPPASGEEIPPKAPQPMLKRLPPRDRARVLAALAGLIILGFALILLAWWGARFTRRYLRRPWPGSERRQADGASEFDWASKALYQEPDGDQQDEGKRRE